MSHFIVIEGLDGAGTTTQVERLRAHVEAAGEPVLATREPTEGPVGRVIRQVLSQAPDAPHIETLPWLFAADRADHLSRRVEPALAQGSWVISDRYYHSSLAYQSLTLPYDRVHALNADFRTPDLTVFVRVTVDACLERIGRRGAALEIYERRDRMEAISASYDAVLEALSAAGEPIVEVDGHQAVDAVTRDIVAHLEARAWLASSTSPA